MYQRKEWKEEKSRNWVPSSKMNYHDCPEYSKISLKEKIQNLLEFLHNLRKLVNIISPCFVISGWNWTPKCGYFLCWTISYSQSDEWPRLIKHSGIIPPAKLSLYTIPIYHLFIKLNSQPRLLWHGNKAVNSLYVLSNNSKNNSQFCLNFRAHRLIFSGFIP